MKIRHILVFLMAASLSLTGCGSTGGSNSGEPSLNLGVKAVLCTAGGFAGAYVGKTLANKYLAKTDTSYTNEEREILVKGFQVGLFLAFCTIANYAGDTLYKKLSKEGQELRRKQVLEAAISAESTTYTDPRNPNIVGTVDVIDRYTEDDGNTDCVVTKDALQIDQSSESILTTQCRKLPNGRFRIIAV